MLTANGTNLNNGTNGHFLNCASDYEPSPVIDITPATASKPDCTGQHATYTHHVQWLDSDNVQHGLTIRSDSLQGLLADLKLIKGMIRQAKAKAAEHAPPQATQTPAPDSDEPPCKIHGTPMVRRQSKRTGGIYFSHKMANGELCFGRTPKA